MILYLIGMGPGNPQYLTMNALARIKEVDHRIAFGRIAQTAEELGVQVEEVKSVRDLATILPQYQGKRVAILASGDVGFYGVLDFLQQKGITIHHVEPGISSFQYLMCKLQKSWHNANLVSLHGRDSGFDSIKEHTLSIVLTDWHNTPASISQRLGEQGMKGKIYVGYELSYKNEEILITTIGAPIPEEKRISILVIENEMDPR